MKYELTPSLFRDDLIKKFVFNSSLNDKMLFHEFFEKGFEQAKKDYFNGNSLASCHPCLTPQNLLFSIDKEGNSIEDIFPQFFIKNFSGLILKLIHSKPVYIKLVNDEMPLLFIELAYTYSEHNHLAYREFTFFVFDKNKIYGYFDILKPGCTNDNEIYNLYCEIKGEISFRDIILEDVNIIREEEISPLSSKSFLPGDWFFISTRFLVKGAINNTALFNDVEGKVSAYRGLIDLSLEDLKYIFNIELSSKLLIGGIRLLCDIIKVRRTVDNYSLLLLIRRSVDSINYFSKEKLGAELYIDRVTKKILEKRFFLSDHSIIGPEILYQEDEIKERFVFLNNNDFHKYSLYSNNYKDKVLFNNEIIKQLNISSFIKNIEKQQEDLYNEYKSNF